MLYRIKKRIDQELGRFLQTADKHYSLAEISPLLFKSIKGFVLRDGKRIRPILFILSYQGFSRKNSPNLYRCALSTELLHDFFLIHDDIIDKSDTRRGKPSLHKVFDRHLAKYKGLKFNGQDLGIVAADIVYALAIKAFLSIKANPLNKKKALQRFVKASVHTGCGEFIELLAAAKKIEDVSKKDIYRIYDYKTAHYTFSSPLTMGAMLAGASEGQINKLAGYGLYSGRAFQIRDDILTLFYDEKKTGKSSLSDLQEAKKTLLIWYAYNHSSRKSKSLIKNILAKKRVTKTDLLQVRKIIKQSGALDYAKGEISNFTRKAKTIISSIKMKEKYKGLLIEYLEQLK